MSSFAHSGGCDHRKPAESAGCSPLDACRVTVIHNMHMRGAPRLAYAGGNTPRAVVDTDFDAYSLDCRHMAPIWPLAKALTTRYDTEAFIQPIAPDNHDVLYRINRSCLPSLPGADVTLRYTVAVVDVDNAGHEPLSADQHQAQIDEVAHKIELAGLPPAAIYTTRAGLRILWPLLTPWLLNTASEAALRARLIRLHQMLLEVGIEGVDMAGTEWTRLFRLPFVVRDGVALELPTDFSRVQPLVCVRGTTCSTIDLIEVPCSPKGGAHGSIRNRTVLAIADC